MTKNLSTKIVCLLWFKNIYVFSSKIKLATVHTIEQFQFVVTDFVI